MPKILLFNLLLITLNSCTSENEENQEITTDLTKTEQAITVYNQTYQENHDVDSIGFIIENATNSYILLDPYEDNVINNISQLKANGNEVAPYISIGTGEDWRTDF